MLKIRKRRKYPVKCSTTHIAGGKGRSPNKKIQQEIHFVAAIPFQKNKWTRTHTSQDHLSVKKKTGDFGWKKSSNQQLSTGCYPRSQSLKKLGFQTDLPWHLVRMASGLKRPEYPGAGTYFHGEKIIFYKVPSVPSVCTWKKFRPSQSSQIYPVLSIQRVYPVPCVANIKNCAKGSLKAYHHQLHHLRSQPYMARTVWR